MSTVILPNFSPAVNLILADGVHPYDHPEDKFVVIVAGEEVAWCATQAAAWAAYTDYLRVEADHQEHCPSDSWFTIKTADYTARVDRETGQVSYEDNEI